jgi:hypothetical protein
MQPESQPFAERNVALHLRRSEPSEGALRIVAGVERQRRVVLRVPVAVRPLRGLLFEMAAVGEQQTAEVGSGRRAIDRPPSLTRRGR